MCKYFSIELHNIPIKKIKENGLDLFHDFIVFNKVPYKIQLTKLPNGYNFITLAKAYQLWMLEIICDKKNNAIHTFDDIKDYHISYDSKNMRFIAFKNITLSEKKLIFDLTIPKYELIKEFYKFTLNINQAEYYPNILSEKDYKPITNVLIDKYLSYEEPNKTALLSENVEFNIKIKFEPSPENNIYFYYSFKTYSKTYTESVSDYCYNFFTSIKQWLENIIINDNKISELEFYDYNTSYYVFYKPITETKALLFIPYPFTPIFAKFSVIVDKYNFVNEIYNEVNKIRKNKKFLTKWYQKKSKNTGLIKEFQSEIVYNYLNKNQSL